MLRKEKACLSVTAASVVFKYWSNYVIELHPQHTNNTLYMYLIIANHLYSPKASSWGFRVPDLVWTPSPKIFLFMALNSADL